MDVGGMNILGPPLRICASSLAGGGAVKQVSAADRSQKLQMASGDLAACRWKIFEIDFESV